MTALAKANTRSRQEWADIIGADWRKSVESILQTGVDLIAARNELPEGEFLRMIDRELPFAKSTAYNLIGVAEHPTLGNFQNLETLPQRMSVLIELSRMDDADVKDALAKGLINSDLKVKPARAIAGAYNKPEGEIVGGAQHMLPSPKEAREIARATGRFVAASDNNIYSGASEAESQAYTHKRNVAFRILEAIETLSEAPAARDWMRGTEKHWFVDFRPGAIDDARKWLLNLKEAMEIVDAN